MTITIEGAVLSGTPCVRETCIAADDIAEMLANGDGIEAIRDCWSRGATRTGKTETRTMNTSECSIDRGSGSVFADLDPRTPILTL